MNAQRKRRKRTAGRTNSIINRDSSLKTRLSLYYASLDTGQAERHATGELFALLMPAQHCGPFNTPPCFKTHVRFVFTPVGEFLIILWPVKSLSEQSADWLETITWWLSLLRTFTAHKLKKKKKLFRTRCSSVLLSEALSAVILLTLKSKNKTKQNKNKTNQIKNKKQNKTKQTKKKPTYNKTERGK